MVCRLGPFLRRLILSRCRGWPWSWGLYDGLNRTRLVETVFIDEFLPLTEPARQFRDCTSRDRISASGATIIPVQYMGLKFACNVVHGNLRGITLVSHEPIPIGEEHSTAFDVSVKIISNPVPIVGYCLRVSYLFRAIPWCVQRLILLDDYPHRSISLPVDFLPEFQE